MALHFLKNLGISVVSVCLTLVLLEGGIRIARPQDFSYWDSHTFRRLQSTYPHFVENIPNSRARFIGVPIAINSLGLRGDEVTVPKPPHTIRVMAVGDSVTFGYGIRMEDTYEKVLEERLNQDAPRGMRYEVLNSGTLGGSLGDYLHFLNEKAAILQPDVVLIGLSLNDILLYSESGAVSETGAQWHGGRMPLARRSSHFLLRHSQLYLFCYARLKSLLYSSGILDINKVRGLSFQALAPVNEYQKRAWQSSFEMLSKVRAFCREHRYRLIVVVFPMQMQLSARELRYYRNSYHLRLSDDALAGEPQRRLREYALTTGMSLVDLLPPFREYVPGELYIRNDMILSDPTHLSVKGNRVAANEICLGLKELLDQP